MGYNLELIQNVFLSGGIWICNNDSFKIVFYVAWVPQSPHMLSVTDYERAASLNVLAWFKPGHR